MNAEKVKKSPSNPGLRSQQTFLKEAGLYHGKVDGDWGPQSRSAMTGFAYQNDAGNMSGDPFTTAPVGYSLHGDLLVKGGNEESGVKTSENTDGAENDGQEPTDDSSASENEAQDPVAEPKGSFKVTGRDGDKPKNA